MVFEGQENSAIQQFWALLGGKTAYMDERVLKSLGETTVPRLFHGSNASGSFKSMFCITYTMVIRVVEFSSGGYKIRKIFA